MRYEYNGFNYTVLSTWSPRGWGPQKIYHSGFDFTRGREINVTIIPHKNGFNVYNFGSFIATLNYRNNDTAAQVRNIIWAYHNYNSLAPGRSAELVDILVDANSMSDFGFGPDMEPDSEAGKLSEEVSGAGFDAVSSVGTLAPSDIISNAITPVSTLSQIIAFFILASMFV